MKIFNSIKTRLQLWYGFFLVVVLMGFVGVSYQLERDRQFNNIDNELRGRTDMLMDSMKRPPPGRPEELPPEEALPERPPENGRRGRPHLPPDTFGEFFDFAGLHGFYFVIWSPAGEELMHSTNAPTDLQIPTGQIWTRQRGDLREMFTPFPGPQPMFVIQVGCSIKSELKAIHQVLEKLIATAGLILFCGLFVGWFIFRRALQPISEISATAEKISAGDLSQRINTAETESELGGLAATLNATFARLEASFAQQAQFTSDAAHELRTPVSVILTQVQSTLKKERSAAEYRETLEACERAAQRMKRLTTSLLELARLDAGQETLRQEKFNLAATAQNCAELVRPVAAEKQITIHTELTEANCIGDADRIAQVITNLLTNAIKYNRNGGEIRVTTRRENNFAVLTVADTGMGISAEDLPRVFERFYRAEKSRTDSSGNAGLGLAICQAIVAAHGGEISAASEAGAVFTVRLPLFFS